MTDNPLQPDPVLIVGAVTWDVVDGQRLPGGAVTYAARAAAALGVRAYILLAAGEDADLAAFAGHEVAVVRVEQTMTLEHRFRDGTRHQRVLARPHRALHPADRPASWPAPRTVVLGTLLPGDIEVPAFLDLHADETMVIAQGLQRSVAADGAVAELDAPSTALLEAARPDVTLCLSEEETGRWDAHHPGALGALLGRCRRIVRTLGAEGAEIRTRDGDADRILHVPALPAAVVDTTGAGDVFATALILAMRAGDQVAGRLAAACAAACVERRGPAPLPARAAILDRAGIPRWEAVRAGLSPGDLEGTQGDQP
jgi:ribokinase